MKLLIELSSNSVVQSISDIDNNGYVMNKIEDRLQQYIHWTCDWNRDDNRIRIYYNDNGVIDINKDDCIIIKD